MTLGTALIIVAILYLIDKHKLWKRAGQLVLAVAVLTMVGGGSWLAWTVHNENKAAASFRAASPQFDPNAAYASAVANSVPLTKKHKVTQVEYDECINRPPSKGDNIFDQIAKCIPVGESY